jgi:hypothetical protein
MKTVFLRVLESDDKAAALLEAMRPLESGLGPRRFEVDPCSFADLPRSPFAYWASDQLKGLFLRLPVFGSEDRTAKVGMQTSDDFRFVRAWWSVPAETLGARWFPFLKGGSAVAFYADTPLCVLWAEEGRELKAFAETTPGTTHWSRNIRSADYYFRPGLTWPLRGVRFSAQAVPRGCIFSIGGKIAFADLPDLPWFLALFNARAFDGLIAFFAGKIGGVQYEAGLIQSIPVPSSAQGRVSAAAERARRAWDLRRSLDSHIETSHAFALPALLQVDGHDLNARVAACVRHVREVEGELARIRSEIDESCFDLYGINEVDRHAIIEGFGSAASEVDASEIELNPEREPPVEVDDESHADAAALAAELASWAVSVAFGRFDVRLAIGAREFPPEPDPFDPLPICSRGMLVEKDGLPPADSPDSYPIAFPEDGMLVDDPGDSRDLTAAVRTVFDTVFGAQADRWWRDTAALLDARGRGLRVWFGSAFLEHHIRQYSKSRRRAPLLWQLGTQSGRYGIWLYSHRLTRDGMFQVQNGVVDPKLAFEERVLTRLVQTAGGNPSASERTKITRQAAFVQELRTMLDEVKRVAPLWNPNLDDGVVLTMAPLWRLVPQHKSWQKELQDKWHELSLGRYDWSHAAMHLWPERVVPKCAEDRSLAIAHGLEEELWAEDADGKWASRQVDDATIDRLVQKRSSAAVKAALADLLAAG